MGCNCRVTEAIIAIAILVFTFWNVSASQWIVSLAAIALLIHSIWCKRCSEEDMPKSSKKKR